MNPPVMLTVTFDHVKHALRAALADHLGEMRALAEKAIEAELNPDRVVTEMRTVASREIQEFVRREIQSAMGDYVGTLLRDHVRDAMLEVMSREVAALLKVAREKAGRDGR